VSSALQSLEQFDVEQVLGATRGALVLDQRQSTEKSDW